MYVEKIENYILSKKKNISINDFFEVYNIKLKPLNNSKNPSYFKYYNT